MFDDMKMCNPPTPCDDSNECCDMIPQPPWDDEDCKNVIEKFLTICLPVVSKPRVRVGRVKTETCGKPIISPQKNCNSCECMGDKECTFSIVQKMKIEIPIDFDIDTRVEDFFLDCEFKKDN